MSLRTPFPTRRGTPDDATAIAACVSAAYKKWIPVIGKEPSPMPQNYAEVIQTEQVFVAQATGLIVGALVLAITEEGLLLQTVAVHPNHSGRGLGTQLLALAEREAALQGFASLYLYTHERMTENLAWYRRCGYAEYARRDEDGYSRVYLRKALRAS